MKKITVFCFSFFLFSCYKAEQNCKDFRTGKFKFEYTLNGVKKITVFERLDSIEIETFNGKTDTSSIRWVNDCEYILQKIHPKNYSEKQPIEMRILSTTQNSYTFEFGILGASKKEKGTVQKL